MQSNYNFSSDVPFLSLNNNESEPLSLQQSEDPATLIHTSFAKVFTLNPKNKIWLPATEGAVPVSFYFDKHRSVYRIISYDASKLVINSTVFPSMTFVQPSSTFGFWNDVKLRTIYGLGFSNQAYRDQTGRVFQKVVKASSQLEQRLPLPPLANTAASTAYSSPTCPPNVKKDTTIYEVMAPLSTTDPNSLESLGEFPELLVKDYELDRQSGASEITQLALKKLQYEREVSKLKQMESELSDLRQTVSMMHETITKKTSEGDRLAKELSEIKVQLEVQKNQTEVTETSLKQEKEHGLALIKDIEDLKQSLDEHTTTIEKLKDKNKEVENENQISRDELIRQSRIDKNASNKNLRNIEGICGEMGDKIGELVTIQDKLKKSFSLDLNN